MPSTGTWWLIGHADELGIDAHRVAIMGDSGRRGHCGGAAILARDRGVPLAKQILIYPMLDDRTVACDDELDGLAHVWFAENNKMAWEAVLGERRGTDEVLPCEAPRATRASRAWRRLSWRWASSTCSATKPSSTRSA